MYKVLLVDDENLVLKSLDAGIDWKKSGFYVAGKANNGTDALQLVKELRPHIVFTDIRMPGISGLELIKQIKEFDSNIQFIVISGYAEFTYVQKSLNYGVLGYCLKPFDDDEIDTMLKRAIDNINELRQKREGCLLDLLEETPSEITQSAIDNILLEEGLTLDTLYVLVTLGKGKLNFSEADKFIRIHIGSARFAYFVQFQNQITFESAIAGNIPEGVLGIGLVKAVRNKNNMMKSIEAATLKAWNFFIHGRTDLYNENDPIQDEKANQMVKQLEKAIIKKDTHLARKLLEEMRIQTNKDCLSILHALKVYNTVYFHMSIDHSNLHEEDYVFSKEQLYHLFHSFDSMIASLNEFLADYEGSGVLQTKKETKNANLKEIIKFLHENYRSDISIQSIAKVFFLNPNYLSQLFKRELNLTFTEYLTNVRLDKAKTLLHTTDLSIGEIAENIGFRDYFYFIRIFKKITQQTPRQYKYNVLTTKGNPNPVESWEE